LISEKKNPNQFKKKLIDFLLLFFIDLVILLLRARPEERRCYKYNVSVKSFVSN